MEDTLKKRVLFVLNDNMIDPLGVMYLMSNCDAIYDILFVNRDNLVRKIRKVNPRDYDIVAFSTITGTHIFHDYIAGYFKRLNSEIISIMGGPHPTFFPRQSISLYNIDYICIGQGIIAFDKFLKGIPTPNIIDKNTVFNYDMLQPLVDINQIKDPQRSTVYFKDDRLTNTIRNFMGSFGCPYNCSYCFNQSYRNIYKGGKRVRFKQPNKFLRQMGDRASRFKTDLVYIQDDTFIINKQWFHKVSNGIYTHTGAQYHCHIRCDITTQQTIRQLKDTGCKSVTFAIQNADYNYRSMYLNRKMKNQKILQISKLLNKYKILFRIQNMVRLPFSSLKEDIDTLKLNRRCKPTIRWASLYQPYPNTTLGNMCKQAQIWNGQIDGINSSFFDKTALKIQDKQKRQRLQKIFSLAVKYRLIRMVLKVLISLDLSIYDKLYLKFKNKMYKKLYL